MILRYFRYIIIRLLFSLNILIFIFSCQNCVNTNADTSEKDTVIKDSIKNNIKDTICKKYLLGMFAPSKDTAFVLAESKYFLKKNQYLRKNVYNAFKEMADAAMKEGVKLKIVSATRTFDEQKNIWEGKWTGKVLYYGKNISSLYPEPVERSKYVLKYSSMPGTSRHHWGTDIDINSVALSYFNTETGKKVYKWLVQNASTYGFCQPYTVKDSLRRTGYEEEKWHWSYFPLASQYMLQYKERVKYSDLKGFAGFETAEKIGVIENYVLEVNKKCQ